MLRIRNPIRWTVLFAILAMTFVLTNRPPPAGARVSEPQASEFSSVQEFLSAANRTSTAAARQTGTAAARAIANATATADWYPTGRRWLMYHYSKWDICGTLVARYTSTPTPTSTPTRTLTPTPTITPTP